MYSMVTAVSNDCVAYLKDAKRTDLESPGRKILVIIYGNRC